MSWHRHLKNLQLLHKNKAQWNSGVINFYTVLLNFILKIRKKHKQVLIRKGLRWVSLDTTLQSQFYNFVYSCRDFFLQFLWMRSFMRNELKIKKQTKLNFSGVYLLFFSRLMFVRSRRSFGDQFCRFPLIFCTFIIWQNILIHSFIF